MINHAFVLERDLSRLFETEAKEYWAKWVNKSLFISSLKTHQIKINKIPNSSFGVTDWLYTNTHTHKWLLHSQLVFKNLLFLLGIKLLITNLLLPPSQLSLTNLHHNILLLLLCHHLPLLTQVTFSWFLAQPISFLFINWVD